MLLLPFLSLLQVSSPSSEFPCTLLSAMLDMNRRDLNSVTRKSHKIITGAGGTPDQAEEERGVMGDDTRTSQQEATTSTAVAATESKTTAGDGAKTAAAAGSGGGSGVADGGSGRTDPFVAMSYASIVGLWISSQFISIPVMPHLLVLVTVILYAACHSSLILREVPDPTKEPDEDGNVPLPPEREVLRKEDAYQFPLVGSASLFSLYLAFKYLDKDLVNLLIGAYFGLVGLLGVSVTIAPLFQRIMTPTGVNRTFRWKYELSHKLPEMLAGPSPWDLSAEFSVSDIVAVLMSIGVCALYFSTKVWYMNNMLAICFCLQAIERFSLGTYKIGAILLIGLFFYDIFWVFGTDVMVTVATKLDGPIKILFPRSLTLNAETGRLDFNLLGLGDIVIPGFFLAILLRFDAHKANVPVHTTDIHADFPKPYFHTTLVAYVGGLITTLFVMYRFNAAQPALLYLVPACLGSSFILAMARGEVKELLEYSEEAEEEEEEEEDEQEKKEGEKPEAEKEAKDKQDKKDD